jgi:hypothetical protein
MVASRCATISGPHGEHPLTEKVALELLTAFEARQMMLLLLDPSPTVNLVGVVFYTESQPQSVGPRLVVMFTVVRYILLSF